MDRDKGVPNLVSIKDQKCLVGARICLNISQPLFMFIYFMKIYLTLFEVDWGENVHK